MLLYITTVLPRRLPVRMPFDRKKGIRIKTKDTKNAGRKSFFFTKRKARHAASKKKVTDVYNLGRKNNAVTASDTINNQTIISTTLLKRNLKKRETQ